MVRKVQRIKAPAAILQLHIELRGTKPKVWRRVLVPETITLLRLHLVIQAAFGWSHSHLHEFMAGDGERYGTADPGDEEGEPLISENTGLTTALRRSTLDYVYDFGDDWTHRIKVERKLAPIPEFTLPFCAGGACATPPEDCGGTSGYADFVQAMADSAHPEHADLAQWIGADTWDPLAFDSIEANDRLAEIKL
jgi:Plasmid pRiA4b ORF-3-like protein